MTEILKDEDNVLNVCFGVTQGACAWMTRSESVCGEDNRTACFLLLYFEFFFKTIEQIFRELKNDSHVSFHGSSCE